MIVYYALGGGMGHLTRACAVIHTLQLKEPITILASARFILCTHHVEVPPPETGARASSPLLKLDVDAGGWVLQQLRRLKPHRLYVDTFPSGLFGELSDADCELVHLARILRWKEYRKWYSQKLPRFQTTYLLEAITPDHLAELTQASTRVVSLLLKDPEAVLPESIESRFRKLKEGGSELWMIVHSGPEDEISELIAYAEEMARAKQKVNAHLLLISPLPTSRVETIDFYPATLLFPFADRLITAAGFNIMRQTIAYRSIQHILPFPRRFDDQFLRAEIVRALLPAHTLSK